MAVSDPQFFHTYFTTAPGGSMHLDLDHGAFAALTAEQRAAARAAFERDVLPALTAFFAKYGA